MERIAAGSVVPRAALGLLSDERLAARAAGSGREAFAVLFGRHHQAVYRYSLAILRNPEDAADVLQTTMLKALQTLASGRKDMAVRPWLFRVAHNEAVSLLRRRGRQVELGEESVAAGAVEDALETRERLAGLLADLGDLPERQRGALVMRELEGLPYERIGEALETSAAAAKQMVHEARQALTEMEGGRTLACAEVTARISERDGRMLRGRALRAHLRDCDRCRGFRDAITSRTAVLSSLPGLPAEQAASILEALLGIGGPGAGTAVAVFSSGAKLGAASLAAKVAVSAAVPLALVMSTSGSAPAASSTTERPVLVHPATAATAVPPLPAASPALQPLRRGGVRTAAPQPVPAAEVPAPTPAGSGGSGEPAGRPAAPSRGDDREETASAGGSTAWQPPSTGTATESSPEAIPSQPSAPTDPAASGEPADPSQPAAAPSTPSEPTGGPAQPAAGTASPGAGETSSGVSAGG